MGGIIEAWPFAGLVVRTPRLVLRWATVEDLLALGREVATSDLSSEFSVPFLVRAKEQGGSVEVSQRALLQFHWSKWAALSPEVWDLLFTVEEGGRRVGLQTLRGKDFRTLREVSSGAWTVQSEQGRGIAVDAHRALLDLAFGHLGARSAVNWSLRSNPASGAASRRIGYEDDGIEVVEVEGAAAETLRFRMTRDRWESVRGEWAPVEVEGLAACLDLLGIDEA